MRTSIQINIPEPCHEDWSKMTPQEKGRHCALCKKTVYDFTNKSDESIVKTFITEGKVCGRFNTSQLNRELVLSRPEKSNYLSFAASTLFAFLSLSTQDIKAQEPIVSPKVDSMLQQNINCVFDTINNNPPKSIFGNVTDALDGLPLPGVNVIVKGVSEGVQTDFDGNFSIHAKTNDTLQFSFIGMKERELIISDQKNITISLEENESQCVKYIVGGYPTVDYYEQCKAKKRRKLRRQQIRNGEIERTGIGQFLYKISNIFRKTE